MRKRIDLQIASLDGIGRRSPSCAIVALRDEEPTLVITGHWQLGRHNVVVYGNLTSLSSRPFDELLELVVARFTTLTVYRLIPSTQTDCEYARVQIHRLRRALDTQLGADVGRSLIETSVATENRLSPTRDEIAVDASFEELPPNVIDLHVFEFLILKCNRTEIAISHTILRIHNNRETELTKQEKCHASRKSCVNRRTHRS